MLADHDTYYCNLDMMRACNEIFLRDGDSSACALYHLSRTFAHVKRRLESEDALSDSTIAIVMSLVSQEQIRQQHAAAQIHTQGLIKLIELRGGLDQLGGNIGLVLKICKSVYDCHIYRIRLTFTLEGPILFSHSKAADQQYTSGIVWPMQSGLWL